MSGIQDRLVVHPLHEPMWFFSACALDAILQAACEWDEDSADMLEAYRAGTVRVMEKKDGKKTDM